MSYEMLSNIWFLIIALVWAVYIIQEAFVVGVSFLSFKYENIKDIKKLNYLVGTHWDGIEVWLILAVAGLFASFPIIFAEILTNLYVVFFLLFFIIVFRGVSIETIFKVDDKKIQNIIIKCWQISSLLLFLVIGIFITNWFIGFKLAVNYSVLPFLHFTYIFNKTAILAGGFFICYALTSGYNFITLNYGQSYSKRLYPIAKWSSIISSILLILVLLSFNNKYSLFDDLYIKYFLIWLLPVFTMLFSVIGTVAIWFNKHIISFISNIFSMISFIFTGFTSLMPFAIIGKNEKNLSILIVDGSAGYSTLKIMLIITIIFLPIILSYIIFKYIRFWGE